MRKALGGTYEPLQLVEIMSCMALSLQYMRRAVANYLERP